MSDLEHIEFIVDKLAKWAGIDISELDAEYDYSETMDNLRNRLEKELS